MLLSGGIDSMACVDFYRNMGRPVCGMFVNYGQPAAGHEAAASSAVAHHFGVQLLTLSVGTMRAKAAGEIPARNACLLCVAAMERPMTVLALAIGIHAGTPYADCSPEFLASAKHMLSLQATPLDVLAPFVDWHKEDIIAYAKKRALPLSITYSCEAGMLPTCGRCASCLDRRSLDARA